MKYILCILCILCSTILYSGIFQYATYDRSNEINYTAIAGTVLYSVQCWEENGDLQTYYIPIPEYSGFSEIEEKSLRESYGKGFCNSL